MRLVPLLMLLLALAACDDDGTAAPVDAGSTPDSGGMCVPEDGEHFALLNAPTGAVTVRKTPRHPPVGDAGLP